MKTSSKAMIAANEASFCRRALEAVLGAAASAAAQLVTKLHRPRDLVFLVGLRRRFVALLPIVLVATCAPPPPTDHIRASGHVEATETRLAPDAGGRILTMTVKEGDRVETGQIILTLDRRDLELALTRVHADVAQADAQLRLVQAAARDEDVRQAESQIAIARADVSVARSELASAEQDLRRFEALLESNAGSRKQRDDAETRRNIVTEGVDLNTLVGVTFMVNGVLMRGVELCAPCRRPSASVCGRPPRPPPKRRSLKFDAPGGAW